jgi:acetylglutamate kinase
VNAYLKAILAAAVPVISAVGIYIQSGQLNAPEFALAVLALINAFLVYVIRNQPGILEAAKFGVSALTPVVTALVTAYITGEWNSAEWAVLVTGWLTAVLVYVSANTPS